MQYFKTALKENDLARVNEYTPQPESALNVEYSLAKVTPIAPATGASGVSIRPLFQWEGLKVLLPSETYFFQVASDSNFENIVFQVRTTETSLDLTQNLEPLTRYYWKVSLETKDVQDESFVTSIAVTGPSTILEGGTAQMSATFDGVGNFPENAEWSVSPEGVAVISQTGLVENLSATATDQLVVTAKSIEFPNVSGTKTLSVVAEALPVEEKDTLQGDFEALQAFYNATQGDDPDIPTLPSVNDLPAASSSTYPHMYLISGEIHFVRLGLANSIVGWENAGVPWKDRTGWDTMTADTMGDAVGVDVDADGRVISLDVQKITSEPYNNGRITTGNGLIGKLVPELKNLKKLRKINLKQNFFFDAIPTGLTNSWPEIERISLGGQRSEINLGDRNASDSTTHRKVFYGDDHFNTDSIGKEVASTNRFRTALDDISDKPNLELYECRGQYTLGTLPEFTNCPALEGIAINWNRGPVSEGISGGIPASWYDLNPMKIYLTNDTERFSGPITDTPNWTKLSVFVVWGNAFSGKSPAFPNARDKRSFITVGNMFDDIVIGEYFNGDNSELNSFSVGDNPYVNPTLPDNIPKPTFPVDRSETGVNDGYRWISSLRLNKCGFTGPIPDWIDVFTRVQIIALEDNEFTGVMPASILNLRLLKTVYLQNNNLVGPLPSGRWVSPRMIVVNISGNNIDGVIPPDWVSIYQDNFGAFSVTITGSYTQSDLTVRSVDENGNTVPSIFYDRTAKVTSVTSSGGNTTITGRADIGSELVVENKGTGAQLGSTFPDIIGEFRDDVRGFDVSNNNLEGPIYDWHKYSVNSLLSRRYFVHNNKFVFADILPYKDALLSTPGIDFRYETQKPFGTQQVLTRSTGQSFEVDYSAKSHPDDVYQWKKGPDDYADTDPTLNIASVSAGDAGLYTLEITNPNAPEMGTLVSNETELQIA